MKIEGTERLVALLEGLGDSPEKIAEALQKAGIKGKQMRCQECPLARYAQARGFDRPLAGHLSLAVDYEPVQDIGYVRIRAWWDQGHPLQEFITRFDRGEFPALIEGPAMVPPHPLEEAAGD